MAVGPPRRRQRACSGRFRTASFFHQVFPFMGELAAGGCDRRNGAGGQSYGGRTRNREPSPPGVDRREIGVDRGAGRGMRPKARELRMMLVAARLAAQHGFASRASRQSAHEPCESR